MQERGRLTTEFGVVMTSQNFGFPVPSSCSCLFCARAGGTEVDTSAGTLSEAKTQRRPHSARERVRGGVSFVGSLFLYLSFSRARRRPVEKMVNTKGGGRVKRGGGLRGLRRDCGGAFGRPCGPRWWRMHSGASGERGVQGRWALQGSTGYKRCSRCLGAKRSRCIRFRFCGK